MFRDLLQGLATRWPSQCTICRSWPAQPVCEACVARFAQPVPRCHACALPLPAGGPRCGACLREPPPLDACLAAVPYAYPWAGLITRFKFGHEPGHARALALLLRSAPGADDVLDQCDGLLPMPLARERLQERGFNQALELARHLAPQKTDASLLLRLRHAPPQSSLPRKQRLGNVQHAFAVDPLQAAGLQGKHVVLLDDVMTSGASLFAAARVLREAGAARITGLVLARTE